MSKEQKKKVVVLATGGTIAGVGDAGENLGYRSGQLSVESLLASVGNLLDSANVELLSEQVCNVNSDDMTGEIWLSLARRVNELQDDSSVDGVVITHGTDTMDETAYFLNLTVCGSKPVVITGSMRPATAKDPDGPRNLADSIKVAAAGGVCSPSLDFVTTSSPSLDFVTTSSPSSAEGRCAKNCVLVCFGGFVYEAFSVQKLSASALNPMGIHYAGEGSIASAEHFEKSFAMGSGAERPASLRFDISSVKNLPQVNVLYFAVDADPQLLEFAGKISDGLVIAGAGSGEFSLKWSSTLSAIQIPVVVSSRIGQGLVTLNEDLAPRGIAAGKLPPQKAAVLLRLALTKTKDPAELRRIFEIANAELH